MAYTSHGKHIPGTGLEGMPDLVARCQGILGCRQCLLEVRRFNADTSVFLQPPTPLDESDSHALQTVYNCLMKAGVDPRKAYVAVSDMQNRGILFRERTQPP